MLEQQKSHIWGFATNKIEQEQGENIHQLFEKHLIENKLLTGRKKADYNQLIININDKNITDLKTTEFKNSLEIKWADEGMRLSIRSCFDRFYRVEKLFSENDWKYKYVVKFNEFERTGDWKDLSIALDEIPENKFGKLVYRKLFLTILFYQD